MNTAKNMVVLWVCLLVFSSVVQAQNTQVLLAEDFEGLSLGPNVDEGLAGAAVWTDIPSPGWLNDDSAMLGADDPATDGVTEWSGWGFADKDWWVQTAGDQRRVEFELGQGTVAVADPDEWDDASHAASTLDVRLSTPPIDLSSSKAGTVRLQFDSSWRPYANQTALITASYDGAEPVEVFRIDSDPASPNYRDDESTNQSIVVDVDNPENAASMVLTIRLFDAGNDWFWAIDNIIVTSEVSPERASNLSPGKGSDELTVKTVLSWTPGAYVGGLSPQHRVMLSEDIAAVENGTAVVSTQDSNSFDLAGHLDYGTTYYWRIDEANRTSDWDEGSIMSFTVEPYSIQIPGSTIAVTASSASNEFSTPERTIDGSGLGADGTHVISPESMWFSASVDLDPWIQYDFDEVKKLDVMAVWNANSSAEMAIGWGVKDVQIEYSADGENWDVLEGAIQLSRATGSPTYNQSDEIDFGGVAAKAVRLNIKSNWGGILMSYGLSEVQFKMIPVAARTPEPASETMDVAADTVLTWRAGREAVQHTIYVGTDAIAVTEGSAPSVTSSTNSLDLSALDLQLGTTYYWRVDEVNDAEANPVWAGPVWQLTTVASLTVDDFESYSNLSPDRPFQTWLDGFGYSSDEFFPTGFGGNGTGAGIGHDIWSLSSAHYDGSIMERTIARSGQSMPFYFDNTTGTSETQRTLDPPQDWTAHGIKSLSLSFRGQAGNSGQLYVKINDTKVAYSGIPNALEKSAWLPMIVDLSTVTTNLNAVTSLAIGVEGAGAQGVVYLDELRLYPLTAQVVEPVAPADNDPDLAGLWKLDEGSGTTATDASGNNHHGVLTNGPFWTTDGAMGGALECDGIDDYVVLDTLSYGEGSDADFSVALWVKTTGWDSDAAIISNKDWNSGGNAGWAIAGGAGNNGSWQWNYSDGSTRADFDPSVAAAPISGGEWVHLCVTHDRDGLARFYHDGQLIGQVDISGLTGSLDAGFPTVLGTDGSEAAVWAYWFAGAFDDVRIYNRVLSAGEILGLNGVTDPVSQPF